MRGTARGTVRGTARGTVRGTARGAQSERHSEADAVRAWVGAVAERAPVLDEHVWQVFLQNGDWRK